MFYVYVIKSLLDGRLYTGSTNNLIRRLSEHNSGKSRYTRLTRPFSLVYKEELSTRSEAVRRELYLKTGKGRNYLKKQLIA